ncbi:hypothetical protein [Azospirillum palustre]
MRNHSLMSGIFSTLTDRNQPSPSHIDVAIRVRIRR